MAIAGNFYTCCRILAGMFDTILVVAALMATNHPLSSLYFPCPQRLFSSSIISLNM
jgi:hypothetical protein